MAISYQTLIWLRWPWNTGLRCAPPMVILRGFAGCAGLIPSRPKGRAGTRVIRIHTRAENTVSTVSDNDHDPRSSQPPPGPVGPARDDSHRPGSTAADDADGADAKAALQYR